MFVSSRRIPAWTALGLMALLLASPSVHAATAAGGLGHSAIALPNGTVWAWGTNDRGQLGDGTVTASLIPAQVPGLASVVAVASGDDHVLALTSTGTLWAWGANDSGQLGDGTTQDRLVPVAVLSGAAGIAAGPDFSIAWKADGSLWTWGANGTGQLGDGTVLPSDTPAAITGVTGVAQASAGEGHVVALTTSGAIWSWGLNASGQVGDGTQLDRHSPVAVTAVPDATVVVAGAGASYAIRSDASVWAWGDNSFGQLGDGTTASRLTAAAAAVPASVQAVRAGGGHVLVRLADATVWTWGRNDSGQVGDGTSVNRSTPAPVGLTGVADVAAGAEHSLAVTTAGVVWAWGRNDLGQLGDGTVEDRLAPAAISGSGFAWRAGRPSLDPPAGTYEVALDVTATSVTSGATVLYTTDGTEPDELSPSTPSGGTVPIEETTTLKAQAIEPAHTPSDVVTAQYTLQVPAVTFSPEGGVYAGPQTVTLACAEVAEIRFTTDGSDPDELAALYAGPIAVTESATLKARAYKPGWEPSAVASAGYDVLGDPAGAIAGGESFSLAFGSDGVLWAWGLNSSGQLGDGTTTLRKFPGLVSGLGTVTAVAAGFRHALAITDSGALYAWGSNASGQLGDGTTTTRKLPIPVVGLSGVAAVGAGKDFSLALLSDGTLLGWGSNQYGQLGLGDTTKRKTPVQVMTGVAEFTVGKYHVIVRKTDGTPWAWGYNGYGRLGDGTTTTRKSPVPVSGLAAVSHVAAGYLHSLAATSGGAVYAWGRNNEGALGDGTTTQRRTPTPAVGLTSPAMLAGGGEHSLAVDAGADAWAWGENNDGELGDGTTTDRHVPTAVPGLSDVVMVAGGWHHSLALTSDSSVYGWGNNPYGQVGDGTSVDRSSPVKVLDSAGVVLATPALTPNGGGFTAEQTVTVDVATPGASIHYTTNGVDPTTSDLQVLPGASVLVDQSLTLKARAFKDGVGESPVAAAVFTLTVPTPSLSPGTGSYDAPQTVTVTCALAEAAIHYTTNGLEPTPSDPVIQSGGTLAVDASQTIKAKAWRTGWAESATYSRTYTMVVGPVVLSPDGGSYGTAQSVSVSTVTPGATLSYTLDGREPNAADSVVASGGTILVDRSLTLRVMGHRFGWSNSVASASYFLLPGTAAKPSFSPAPGSYSGEQLVTLASGTAAAIFRYTTDGSEPGPGSLLYTGPVTIDTTVTLRAKAFKSDLAASATATGEYTISNPGAVATPTFAPGPGQYTAGRSVTITTATAGATLRYTITGANPTASDPEITSGASITVDRTLSLRAKGWKTGLTESGIRTGTYVVTGSLAAGPNFILALKADGTVVGWGSNNYGQLGDGTTANSGVPVAAGLSSIVAVAAGERHSAALHSDGTVFCWGDNSDGQLGDGTTTASLVPQQVPGLSGVVAIAAGDYHTLAVKSDGTAWAWGENNYRQLGDGTNIMRTSPVPISGLSSVVSLAGGRYHSLALTAAGEVWGWGWNNVGQVGDGTTTLRATPVSVPGLSGVSQIWAGQFFSFALKSDGLDTGTLWGWGDNGDGQLGTGDTGTRRSPVFILDGVRSMAAGQFHVLAIKQDGSLWAWGAGGGTQGRIGDGARMNRYAPVQVWGLRDVVVAAAGASYSAAVRADGSVVNWGYNPGNTASDTPVPVADLSVADNAWLADDVDGDGLSAWSEWRLGCDPLAADSNGDGIGDGTSVELGLSCWSPDLDEDGIANSEEIALGTSPWDPDTDADGAPDGADCAPLDPSRTSCLLDPDDHTPPVVTILEPPNATPVP